MRMKKEILNMRKNMKNIRRSVAIAICLLLVISTILGLLKLTGGFTNSYDKTNTNVKADTGYQSTGSTKAASAMKEGGTYYFDLSQFHPTTGANNFGGIVNIDGKSRESAGVPDPSLKYVPFTYYGDMTGAYNLESETDTNTIADPAYDLFMADMNILDSVSWEKINEKRIVFGNSPVFNTNYKLRIPSGGTSGNTSGGTPPSNEWDMILMNGNTIKNWSGKNTWCQDGDASNRVTRGSTSGFRWSIIKDYMIDKSVGWRPALEVLKADDLQPITLYLNSGTFQEAEDLSNGNIVELAPSSKIDIVVNGSQATYKAPEQGAIKRPAGIPGTYFAWYSGNGTKYMPGANVKVSDGTTLTAVWDPSTAYDPLPKGETYYFDLSQYHPTDGANKLGGTVNTGAPAEYGSPASAGVPDPSLKYVPFTYYGPMTGAYNLENSGDTDTTAEDPAYNLFMADMNILTGVSWDMIKTADLVYGTTFNTNYKLRLPSVGTAVAEPETAGGTPLNNEWDTILNNGNTIKNWGGIYSWGQDIADTSTRAVRGCNSARHWSHFSASYNLTFFGWRPVIEVLNADNLLPIELNLDGGTFQRAADLSNGNTAIPAPSSTINIVVDGSQTTYKAPEKGGIKRPTGDTGTYFGWNTKADGSGDHYIPGDPVPKEFTTLYAVYIDTVIEILDSHVSISGNFTYTGSQIKPSVSVAIDGITLINGTDYTISYGTNVNAGTNVGSVTVTGNETINAAGKKYSGAVTKNFTIAKATPIAHVAPKPVLPWYYSGPNLSSVKLTGGSAKNAISGTIVPGTYAVNHGGTITAGNNSRKTVVFVPTDKNNYNTNSAFSTVTIVGKNTMARPTYSSKVYTGSKLTASITPYSAYSIVNNGGTNVGSYPVTIHITSSNFAWTGGEGQASSLSDIVTPFQITKATGSIGTPSKANFEYSGNSGASPSVSSVSPLTATVGYKYSTTANGTYSTTVPVNADTYYIKAFISNNTNHTGATSSPVAFVINQKLLTPVWTAPTDLTYSKVAKVPSVSLSGVVSGETVTASIGKWSGDAVYFGKPFSYTIDGLSSNNYTLNQPTSPTYTITQRPVSVSRWDAPSNLEYTGTKKFATPVLTNIISSDSCTPNLINYYGTDNINANKGFKTQISSLSNNNYKLSTTSYSQEYKVTPKAMSVTPTLRNHVYGESIVQSDNFAGVSGETLNVVYNIVHTNGGTVPNDGVYYDAGSWNFAQNGHIVTGGQETSANYNVSVINGANKLIISKKPITIKTPTGSKTYDGTPLSNTNCTIVSGGLVGGNTVSYSNGTAITNVSHVYNYVIPVITRGGRNNTNNYAITYQNGTLQITKATPVLATAPTNPKTWYYTGKSTNNIPITGATAKLNNTSTTVAGSFSHVTATSITQGTKAYTIRFTPSGADAANFFTADFSMNMMGKTAINTPSFASKTYTGGTLTASIPAGNFKVDRNKGGTTVGGYDVLVSPVINHAWAGAEGQMSSTSQKGQKFYITQANSVITTPTKSNITYYNNTGPAPSATVTTPSVTRPTISYTYSTNSTSGFTATAPTDAGYYYVKASITGNENYTSATSSVGSFTIFKATPTFSGSINNVVYGSSTTSLSNSLTAVGVNSSSDEQNLGTITATYTPTSGDKSSGGYLKANTATGYTANFYFAPNTANGKNYKEINSNSNFKVTQKPITVSKKSSDPLTKVYDGNTNTSGFVYADRITTNYLSGDRIYLNASTSYNSKDVASATTATYSYTGKNGDDSANYSLVNGSIAYTANITPRTANIQWNGENNSTTDFSWVYDGNSHIPTATTYDNAITGDTFSITTRGEQTNASGYTAAISGLGNTNYKLPTDGTELRTFAITKANPTFSGSINNVVYGTIGNSPTKVSNSLTAVGVNSSTNEQDLGTITATYSPKSGETSTGGYLKSNTATGYTANFHFAPNTANGKNYNAVNGNSNFKVTQKPISGTAVNDVKLSKIYDGDNTVDNFVYADRVNLNKLTGDVVSVLSGNYTYNFKDVNSANTVTLNGTAIGGTDSGNYSYNSSSSYAFSGATITQKEVSLVWTAPTATDLIYDGKINVPTVTVNGEVSTEDINAIIALTSTKDDINVGGFTYTASALTDAAALKSKNLDEKAVTVSSNYKLPTGISGVTSAEYTIAPRTVGIDWKTTNSATGTSYNTAYTYSGMTQGVYPFINNAQSNASNVKDNVALAVANNLKTDANGTTVVTETSYTTQTVTFLNNEKGNYALPTDSTTTKTFTINQKDITYKAEDATKQYDGTPLTNVTATKTAGDLVNGQTVAFTSSSTITDFIDVGVDNIVDVVISQGENDVTYNYNLVENKGNLSITKRPVTIEWNQTNSADGVEYATGYIYTGLTQGVYPFITDIIKIGENPADDVSLSVANNTALNYSATAYKADTVALAGTKAHNYTITDTPTQEFTIGKKTITVDPVLETITYGDKTTTATDTLIDTTIAGVNGEVLTVKYGTDATNSGNYYDAGTHDISTITLTIVTGDNDVLDNYSVGMENATDKFVVDPRVINLKWTNHGTRTYNGIPSTVAVEVTNLVETTTGKFDEVPLTLSNGTQTNVKFDTDGNAIAHTASVNVPTHKNYSLPTSITQDYLIEKAAMPTITELGLETATNSIYGVKVQDFTFTNGVVQTDGIKNLTGTWKWNTADLGKTPTVVDTGYIATFTMPVEDKTNYLWTETVQENYSYSDGVISKNMIPTITARTVGIEWNTTNSATGDIYNADYTYLGVEQGVYPFITNLVTIDGTVDAVSLVPGNNVKTNQGTYTTDVVIFQGTRSGNYALPADGTTTETFKINKQAIEYTADNLTKEYDGTPLTDINATVTNGGLVNKQLPTFVSASTITDYVDGGINNVVTVIIKDGELDVTDNYAITYVDGNLAITKRPVTIEWKQTNSADGAEYATGYIYTGLTQGVYPFITDIIKIGENPADDVSLSVANNTALNYSATAYKADTVALAGTKAHNYTITDTPTKEFTIGKKAITVDPVLETIIYGAKTTTAIDTLIDTTIAGVNGEVLTVKYGTDATNSGNYYDAGTHDISTITLTIVTGDNDVLDNYSVGMENATDKFVVDPRVINLKWTNHGTRTYNGIPSTVAVEVTNLVETTTGKFDEVPLTLSNGTQTNVKFDTDGNAIAHTASVNVPTHKNYSLPTSITQDYLIEKAAMPTITELGLETATNSIYGVKVQDFTFTNGVVQTDGIKNLTGTWKWNTADLGKTPTVVDTGYIATFTMPVEDKTNYLWTETVQENYSYSDGVISKNMIPTITARTVGIEWNTTNSATGDIYNADYTYLGVEQGVYPFITNLVTIDGTVDAVSLVPGNNVKTNQGTYTTDVVIFQGTRSGNYALPADGTTTETFKINKQAIEYTADNLTKEYDGTPLTDINATVTNGGLVNKQLPTFVSASTITDYVDGGINNVVTVIIKDGELDVTDNYAITYVDGNLAITKRPVTIEWNQTNSTDGVEYATDYTYSGLTQGVYPFITDIIKIGENPADDVSLTVANNTALNYSATPYTANTVALDGAKAHNYTITDTPTKEFSIGKKTITVDPVLETITYGDKTTTATDTLIDTTIAGVNGEVLTVKYGTDATNSGNYYDAGTHNIDEITLESIVGTNNLITNYTVALGDKANKFVVNKRVIEILWADETTRTYDGLASTLSATVNNLLKTSPTTTDSVLLTVTNGNQTNVKFDPTTFDAVVHTATVSIDTVGTTSEVTLKNYELPTVITEDYLIEKAPSPEITAPLTLTGAGQVYGVTVNDYGFENGVVGSGSIASVIGTWDWIESDKTIIPDVANTGYVAKFTLTNEVDKTNYNWNSAIAPKAATLAETTEPEYTYEDGVISKNMIPELINAEITDFEVADVIVTYDGLEKSITVPTPTVINNQKITIKYKTDDALTFESEQNPQFSQMGMYSVYYQISVPNHNTKEWKHAVNIGFKTLIWAEGVVADKDYDASIDVEIATAPQLVGIVESDHVAIALGDVTFKGKDQGKHPVTALGYGTGGLDANNYKIIDPNAPATHDYDPYNIANYTIDVDAPVVQPKFADAEILPKEIVTVWGTDDVVDDFTFNTAQQKPEAIALTGVVNSEGVAETVTITTTISTGVDTATDGIFSGKHTATATIDGNLEGNYVLANTVREYTILDDDIELVTITGDLSPAILETTATNDLTKETVTNFGDLTLAWEQFDEATSSYIPMADGDKFFAFIPYRATVTAEANINYNFANAINVTIPNKTAVTVTETQNLLTITMDFEPLATIHQPTPIVLGGVTDDESGEVFPLTGITIGVGNLADSLSKFSLPLTGGETTLSMEFISETGEVIHAEDVLTVLETGTFEVVVTSAATNEYTEKTATYSLEILKGSNAISFAEEIRELFLLDNYYTNELTNISTATNEIKFKSTEPDAVQVDSKGKIYVREIPTSDVTITATLAENELWNESVITYTVTVPTGKIPLTVQTKPTAEFVYYFDTLSESVIIDGVVIDDEGTVINGVWKWAIGRTVLNEIGADKTQILTFVPEGNPSKYTTVTELVAVEVKPRKILSIDPVTSITTKEIGTEFIDLGLPTSVKVNVSSLDISGSELWDTSITATYSDTGYSKVNTNDQTIVGTITTIDGLEIVTVSTFNVIVNLGTATGAVTPKFDTTTTFTYDGLPHGIAISNMDALAEYVASVEITYSKNGETASATVPTNAGDYKVVANFTMIGDYTAIEPLETVMTISQIELEIAKTEAVLTKEYDGTSVLHVGEIDNTYYTITGVLEGENVTLEPISARYNSTTVKDAKTVGVKYKLAGTHGENYTTKTDEITIDGAITPIQLEFKADSVKVDSQNITDNLPLYFDYELTGLIGSDSVIINFTYEPIDRTAPGIIDVTITEVTMSADSVGSENYLAPAIPTGIKMEIIGETGIEITIEEIARIYGADELKVTGNSVEITLDPTEYEAIDKVTSQPTTGTMKLTITNKNISTGKYLTAGTHNVKYEFTNGTDTASGRVDLVVATKEIEITDIVLVEGKIADGGNQVPYTGGKITAGGLETGDHVASDVSVRANGVVGEVNVTGFKNIRGKDSKNYVVAGETEVDLGAYTIKKALDDNPIIPEVPTFPDNIPDFDVEAIDNAMKENIISGGFTDEQLDNLNDMYGKVYDPNTIKEDFDGKEVVVTANGKLITDSDEYLGELFGMISSIGLTGHEGTVDIHTEIKSISGIAFEDSNRHELDGKIVKEAYDIAVITTIGGVATKRTIPEGDNIVVKLKIGEGIIGYSPDIYVSSERPEIASNRGFDLSTDYVKVEKVDMRFETDDDGNSYAIFSMNQLGEVLIVANEKKNGGGGDIESPINGMVYWNEMMGLLEVNVDSEMYISAIDGANYVPKKILVEHATKDMILTLEFKEGTIVITPEMAARVEYTQSQYTYDELVDLYYIPTPTPTPTPTPVEPDNDNTLTILILSILLFILIQIAVLRVIYIKYKKKKQK